MKTSILNMFFFIDILPLTSGMVQDIQASYYAPVFRLNNLVFHD